MSDARATYLAPVIDRRSARIAQALGALVIAATVTVSVVARAGTWVGWLPATVTAWSLASMFAMASAAALGAWLGGSVRRAGMTEWVESAPQGRARAMRRPLLESSLTAGGSALLVLGVMLVLGFSRGMPWAVAPTQCVLVVVIVLLSIIASAALGVALGRAWPAFVAVPLGAVVVYLVYGLVLGTLGDTLWQRLWPSDGGVWQVETHSLVLLVERTLWWAGLATAVAALAAGRRRVLAGAALVAVSAAAAIAGVSAAAVHMPLAGASGEVCDPGTVRVCVPKPQLAALTPFAKAVREDLATLPPAYRPTAIASGIRPAKTAELPLSPRTDRFEPAALVDRSLVTVDIGQTIFLSGCSTTGRYDSAATVMVWWLRAHGLDPTQQIAPGAWSVSAGSEEARRYEVGAERLAAMPTAQRNKWLTDHRQEIVRCALPAKALPG